MVKRKYFKDKEFYCKCGLCQKKTVSKELLRKINKAREISGTPFIINSWWIAYLITHERFSK